MNKLIKYIIALIVLFSLPAFALENLDELETRTARKSVNTFYSGEDSGNYYIWQPQTVIYTDITSGNEVMIFTQTPNKAVFTGGTEYGAQWWSADGKRMSYNVDLTVGNFTPRAGQPWFVARSDGTYLRPFSESVNRGSTRLIYFDWSPTDIDIAWHMGYETSYSSDTIYKVSVTDTGGSNSAWVDVGTGELIGCMKNAVTPDGRLYITSTFAENVNPLYIVDLENQTNKLNYNLPTLDTYWGDTQADDTHLHDEWFVGNATNGYWFVFYTSNERTHWRLAPWGTDGNAPNHIQDHTSLYTWWNADSEDPTEWDSTNNIPGDSNKEVQPVGGNDAYGSYWPLHWIDATCTDGNQHYPSHNAVDRYGTMNVMSDTECYWPQQFTIWDIDGSTVAATTALFVPNYTAWTGFTDYAAGVQHVGDIGIIGIGGDSTYHWTADVHNSGGTDFVSPSQSPDGTKIGVKSDWLNPTVDRADTFIAVAYFPYPPEITACTATSGTVTTTFEWMLDSTPRSYTTRGWPHEDDDDPCPPRETEKFRLWRSSDKSTWTPITTTDAEIFTRYDFSDGTWDGNDYWTITDVPGDGTWYYAVTSVEWSGLESRTLSNIFEIVVSSGSGTGAEDTGYPASPGDLDNIATSDFYTSYNSANASKLKRYYNIYAEDGSSPSISQTNRVASISKNACSGGNCSWVDWLGKTDGTTKYVITVVDTQGNESTGISLTATHKKSPATADGQYTLEWDDVGYSSASISSISSPGNLTGTIQ